MKLWDITITYETVAGVQTSMLTFEAENEQEALKEAKQFFASELPRLKITSFKVSRTPYR